MMLKSVSRQICLPILHAASSAGSLRVLRGRLREAAATYEQVLHLVPEQEVLRVLVGSAGYYFGLGDLLREWNDLDAAERFLAQGMELVRGTLTVAAHVVTQGYATQARLQQARGDYHGAIATLDAFEQLARERHFISDVGVHMAAVRTQVELAQGNLKASVRWVDASGLTASDEDLSYPHEREYLTLVRVRIAQGRADPVGSFLQDALHLLDRLLTDAEIKARMSSVLEILVLRALALHAQSDRAGALSTLERALMFAEPEGYVRLFVDEGAPMLTLLRQAHAH